MQLLQKLLNKFNGLHYKQEYLCLGAESFPNQLHIYLVDGNKVICDITNSHLFSGYHPLIFTLFSRDPEDLPNDIKLIFSPQPNEDLNNKEVLAQLFLKRFKVQQAGAINLSYYECDHGSHQFLSSLHQYVVDLNNHLFNKKPGNVFLVRNLYKQVQIAYALPRNISLVTVSNNDLYNLFPTDLHGCINEHYYSISLRQNGKACEQVEATRRILVSEMEGNAYKTVYALGKNHMQPMKSKESFPFGELHSANFNLPVPASATKYRELELIESFDHGIHRLHLFKIISTQLLNEKASTLAHIHNTYATWRHNNGLPGNYLFR
jgi:hypothetical protein